MSMAVCPVFATVTVSWLASSGPVRPIAMVRLIFMSWPPNTPTGLSGNKRIALIAAAVFLRINGLALNASEIDAAITFKALASGGLAEAELTAWLRANTEPL